jgi:hypothetical protein
LTALPRSGSVPSFSVSCRAARPAGVAARRGPKANSYHPHGVRTYRLNRRSGIPRDLLEPSRVHPTETSLDMEKLQHIFVFVGGQIFQATRPDRGALPPTCMAPRRAGGALARSTPGAMPSPHRTWCGQRPSRRAAPSGQVPRPKGCLTSRSTTSRHSGCKTASWGVKQRMGNVVRAFSLFQCVLNYYKTQHLRTTRCVCGFQDDGRHRRIGRPIRTAERRVKRFEN